MSHSHDVADSHETSGQLRGQSAIISAKPSLPIIPLPTTRPPVPPSRIPRPIPKAALGVPQTNDAFKHSSTRQDYRLTVPGLPKDSTTGRLGYLTPTFASSQRQRKPLRPIHRRSTPAGAVGMVSPNVPAEHVAERNVSRIPVLSKTRTRTPSPGTAIPSLSPPRVSTPPPIRSSPPPEYSERPTRRPCTTNLLLPPPASSPEPSPVYREQPAELEYELYVCPYSPDDPEECEATTPPLSFRGEKLKFNKSWRGKNIPASMEGMDIDPQLDDLARNILEDIFRVLNSRPSARTIALYAYASR